MNELHSFFKWAALIVIATIIYDARYEKYHFFKHNARVIRCDKLTGVCEISDDDGWYSLAQDPVVRFFKDESLKNRRETADKMVKEKIAEEAKNQVKKKAVY